MTYIGIQWEDGAWASRGVYVGYDDDKGSWFWELRDKDGNALEESERTRHDGFAHRIDAIDNAYETIKEGAFGEHLDLSHLKRYTSGTQA